MSCRMSRVDRVRSNSRSSMWRTSTPMSESRPRSTSELSMLTVAKLRMPGQRGGRDQGGGTGTLSILPQG